MERLLRQDCSVGTQVVREIGNRFFSSKSSTVLRSPWESTHLDIQPIKVASIRISESRTTSFIDVKHAELAPRIHSEVFETVDAKDAYLKTASALKPLTSTESSNASLQIPTKDKIEREDFDTINIKLINGSYSSEEVTCKIESIVNTIIDNAPITLIALRIQYKNSKAPQAIVYRLRRVKEVATWDALYTLCNTYRFGSVSNLQLTSEDEKLKLDINGVALNLSDFQKPTYGGQSAATKTPAT